MPLFGQFAFIGCPKVILISPIFNDIFYYSIVTFTTLGYGDLTLSTDWKLLSGVEAINGIMLIGWSTALMYTLIQNIFKILSAKDGR